MEVRISGLRNCEVSEVSKRNTMCAPHRRPIGLFVIVRVCRQGTRRSGHVTLAKPWNTGRGDSMQNTVAGVGMGVMSNVMLRCEGYQCRGIAVRAECINERVGQNLDFRNIRKWLWEIVNEDTVDCV